MKKAVASIVLLAACSGSSQVCAEVEALDGLVTEAGGSGLHDVSIYAYEVARAQVREVVTDPGGRFSFPALPSGLYKLVAFKRGFAPAIAVLSRAADQGLQFVELELTRESGSATTKNDFWSLREAIPGDVLRDIERTVLAEVTTPMPRFDAAFEGSVRAEAGVQGQGESKGQYSGASIDLAGRLGDLDVGLDGRFRRLDGAGAPSASPAGMAELGVWLSGSAGTLQYEGRRDRLESLTRDDGIELAHHRVAWSHEGESQRSAIAAEYVDRGELYLASGLARLALPFAERSWRIEGSWERELDSLGGIATSIRYIENELSTSTLAPAELARTLEVAGEAGWHASPTVLVEYGVFTRFQDGSLTLAPRGSVVVQLAEQWQARLSASGRVVDERSAVEPWSTALQSSEWSSGDDCSGHEERCVRLGIVHQAEPGTSFEVAAVSRQVGDLVRLTFDEAVFDGLLLLPGDDLPELSIAATNRIGESISTRFAAAVAEGGGGELQGLSSAQNQVAYRVTSLETQFERTETGVFVAFHELSQGLDLSGTDGAGSTEMRRLQVRVTQNLDRVLRLASNWALQLGMELSKGRLPFSPPEAQTDEVRQRLTGGVAVRF
jgi:hypothetical protein